MNITSLGQSYEVYLSTITAIENGKPISFCSNEHVVTGQIN
jgi:hypothetical protein